MQSLGYTSVSELHLNRDRTLGKIDLCMRAQPVTIAFSGNVLELRCARKRKMLYFH